MTEHTLEVNEGADVADSVAPPVSVETAEFEVINPIFKNGKEYEPGDTATLEINTGLRFVEAGDVKETE